MKKQELLDIIQNVYDKLDTLEGDLKSSIRDMRRDLENIPEEAKEIEDTEKEKDDED